MALTYTAITANTASVLENFETQIEALVAKPELTSAELIQLQRLASEWAFAQNMISTILKSLSDSLQNTLRKIN